METGTQAEHVLPVIIEQPIAKVESTPTVVGIATEQVQLMTQCTSKSSVEIAVTENAEFNLAQAIAVSTTTEFLQLVPEFNLAHGNSEPAQLSAEPEPITNDPVTFVTVELEAGGKAEAKAGRTRSKSRSRIRSRSSHGDSDSNSNSNCNRNSSM